MYQAHIGSFHPTGRSKFTNHLTKPTPKTTKSKVHLCWLLVAVLATAQLNSLDKNVSIPAGWTTNSLNDNTKYTMVSWTTKSVKLTVDVNTAGWRTNPAMDNCKYNCKLSNLKIQPVGTRSGNLYHIGNKTLNKIIKSINCNGVNSINIAHWNLGSTHWKRKVHHAQHLVDELKPDYLFISEANIYNDTPEYEVIIQGYTLHKPLTVQLHNHARLVLLAKEGLNFSIRSELMDNIVTSIWIKVITPGARKVNICGIYREHQYKLQPAPNLSASYPAQHTRWNIFMEQVSRASSNGDSCTIIGDTNLDFLNWNTPDHNHTPMVERSKDVLENGDFTQLVNGFTRSWPNTADSLIDQCWLNTLERILSCSNLIRAQGDHNLIQARIRLKGKDAKRLDTNRRNYKTFTPVQYRNHLSSVNWEEIYSLTSTVLVYDFLENAVLNALDNTAPMKVIQFCKKRKPWISQETKDVIELQDSTREAARQSGLPAIWNQYQRIKNNCNRKVDKDRKKLFNDKYEMMNDEKDIKGTYSTAKQQVRWKTTGPPTSFMSDGKKVSNYQQMAEIQKKCFVKKVEKN